MFTGKMAESTPRKCAAPHINTVCRCCNNSLLPANHPIDLFGQKKTMKDENIDTLKLIGIHVARDDGLPQRICKPCSRKIIKVQQFTNLCLHSQKQQQSVLRFKRARKAADSPSVGSPSSGRPKKKTGNTGYFDSLI